MTKADEFGEHWADEMNGAALPWGVAISSFLSFATGAVLPVFPYMLG